MVTADEESQGLTVVKAKLDIFLHPSRSGHIIAGVQETLDSLLLRYNERLQGVVLAYLDPNILGRKHKILPGLNPYFHVGLIANLLLFSPTAGMRIEGKVNKIEKDYIGVLTMGIFNAALSVLDIRDDLYFEELSHERIWTSKTDHRHVIKLGSMLSFVIKSVQETGEFLDISGSLCSPDTGCMDWISGLNEPCRVQNELENRIESSRERRRKEKKRRRETLEITASD